VLKSRSAQATADWLEPPHPGIEVVSRDRCGLYAQGIRKGAPRARQVADRFHLLQNLRENIERELTSASRFAGRSPASGDRQESERRERRLSRQALFVRAK
jgi:transposase